MKRDPNYFGDVVYDVWRSGGNSDLVDRDRVRDYEYDGYRSDEASRAEMYLQRRYRSEPEQIQEEEQPRDWFDDDTGVEKE